MTLLHQQSYRYRIIREVQYTRRNEEQKYHPYHDLPDDLLTEIFTADPVSVTTRRSLHPRLAFVYYPFLMCRHPVDHLAVMKGFVKTYLALNTDFVTPQTVMTSPTSHCRNSRSRREAQLCIRRNAWLKTWREENPIDKGDATVVGIFAKYAMYAFLVRTVEAFVEPTGEEFWEEFQLELCKQKERADLALKRLNNLRKQRFDRLQNFLVALRYHLPIAINGIFKTEQSKQHCEKFMADIFHRVVRIAQQEEWPQPHILRIHFMVDRPLVVQMNEFRLHHDRLQLDLSKP